MNSRDEVLTLLGDAAAYWGTYHNHKETGAWAGLVVFVVLVALLDSVAGVLIVSAITLVYLYQQFSSRFVAANLAAACWLLRAEIVAKPATDIDLASYAPSTNAAQPFPAGHFMPSPVMAAAQRMAARPRGARIALEVVAYGLVIVVALVAVSDLWDS
ncbi:MAG: hypothetical protein ABIU95_11490 [Burkholderiales bacterium]